MPVNTLIDFTEIANKTENFTGADLKLLLKEVTNKSVYAVYCTLVIYVYMRLIYTRFTQAGYAALLRDRNAREIVSDDVTAALRLVKPNDRLKKFSNMYESFR